MCAAEYRWTGLDWFTIMILHKDCTPIKGSPIIIIVEEDWQQNNISI